LNVKGVVFAKGESRDFEASLEAFIGRDKVGEIGVVKRGLASKFDIKQPVLYADLYWDILVQRAGSRIQFKEISKSGGTGLGDGGTEEHVLWRDSGAD
jgi:phenylalanyl-tRNA synthetase beta chain